MPRGGKRAGSGRPAGSRNRATREISVAISKAAREYSAEALETLVDVARNGSTDSARVAAANALLDRAYGRTAQGFDLIPISTVADLQRKMADVVCVHVKDRETASKIAEDWLKIEVQVKAAA